MVSTLAHDRLAALLRYPDAAYFDDVQTNCRVITETDAAVGERVARFAAQVQEHSRADLEELFTQTFDINPVCSLEVGWQLFGEEYERGTFLVRMRQEMRRLGLPETTELPDHLGHVLAVLARMEPARAGDFASACVLPAVDRMCASLAGKAVPYEHVLQAIRVFLAARYGTATQPAADGPANAAAQPTE